MTLDAIAIIGISCRFPMADNKDAFWQLLRDGVDAVTPAPSDRSSHNKLAVEDDDKDRGNDLYGGFLKEIDRFDPHFFGISSSEATVIDPQQRLLLEASWEALEDAGQVPAALSSSRTGVFIGIARKQYDRLGDNPIAEDSDREGAYYITSQDTSIAANRISFQFNFRGPSVAVNTACSSALVALHQARQSLVLGESNLAVVGGINLIFSSYEKALWLEQARLLSATGRCRSFDASADGYVPGEGVGVVVLKRLSEAKADGDRIYAVIRSSAINHNGRGNGLSAPNPQAQKALLRDAYQQAGVSPGQVQYVEAHGSGTPLGDLLELKALGEVLAEDRPSDKRCIVGSVKTNLGNTEIASGIAGLIKVALSLKHRQIPPHLHFEQPSDQTAFDRLPLAIETRLTDWPTDAQTTAIASVSAFGLGGTNVHVVLEGEPEVQKLASDDSVADQPFLFVLSAKSEEALVGLAQRYQRFLSDLLKAPVEISSETSIVNICYTVCVRRSHFRYRLAIVTRSSQDLCNQLSHLLHNQTSPEYLSEFIHKAKRHQRNAAQSIIQYPQIATLPRSEQDLALHTLAQHWLAGADINWVPAYSHIPHQFVSVPTYSFQRQSYWISSNSSSSQIQIGSKPQCIEPEISAVYVAPENDIQQKVADLWQTLLEVDKVGIYDSLYELGSDSVMAAQMITRMQENWLIELPISSLFENSTVYAQAALISQELKKRKEIEQDQIQTLLDELDLLSDEEAKKAY